MTTGRSSVERTMQDRERNQPRRQYRAPSLAKGPMLATVTAGSDTVTSGVVN
jgi:hypothetical protein